MTPDNKQKLIVYQVFPRIFTNEDGTCVPGGTLEQNGCGKLNDFDGTLLDALADLGVNCVWYTGIIEHATKSAFPGIPSDNPHIVKGEAGSPYAIRDYYDVDPALATDLDRRVEEFRELVKRTHRAGMKAIIDFVPNHTARRYHSDAAPEGVEDFGAHDDITMGFAPQNNYYYITNQQFSPQFSLGTGAEAYHEFPAKATGNDCFTAFCSEFDWYETVKLNYGHDYWDGSDHFYPVPDTWLKMRDILLFWAATGIDGFRCDMVFMVPQPFWHWVTAEVRKKYPHIIFIGEIYAVGLYRPFLDYCGFDYLYDKVNLYDTLVGIERHGYSAARLTECWQTVDGIGDRMLNFLENHDEVRYASQEFAGDPSKVTPALVTSAMISTGPFMIYYGQELGEAATENEGFAGYNNRTTIFDYWSYGTMRRWYDGGKCHEALLSEGERWLRDRYRTVLRLCNSEKPISRGEFFDLMYVNLQNPDFDPHHLFAFLRYTADEALLIVANFGEDDARAKVNVPDLAFSMVGLPEGTLKVSELLTGEKRTLTLGRNLPSAVTVGAHDAVVLKVALPPKEISKNPNNPKSNS